MGTPRVPSLAAMGRRSRSRALALPAYLEPSRNSTTPLASCTAPQAASTRKRFSLPRAAWMPGVSRKTICSSAVVRMPVMLVRVVWGLGETMAIFSPRTAFRKVDFPALGGPMRAMKPALYVLCVISMQSL
ncbi:hypothetical protein DSECCO2_446530 [anaerobic digester metagenome]